MSPRPRMTQFVWIATAAALLLAAGAIQRPLAERARDYELVAPNVLENHPELVLLSVAPGGLRAPVVNYLWIRANLLKQEGRYYDAKQLAGVICALQPNFPGVWSFHAWNMAWNISAATQSPQERWLWIENGIELLRDKGIAANPRSLMLYKDLAWIFFSKIGGFSDDHNLEYKQRWAARMQSLLGAPPAGDAREVIEAFRPIAEAPLDESPARQGKQIIQADRLEEVLSAEDVRQYAALLREHDVAVDEMLLGIYNRYSNDDAAAAVRIGSPGVRGETGKALSGLINDPAHAEARGKLLSFVRAQILWNKYKMSPARMLRTMQRYGAPLDWRQCWTHAIYWANYGIEVTGSESLSKVSVLNIDRIVLNSLKQMTWRGRISMILNPRNPDEPFISLSSDWRFIDPTHKEFMRFITAMQEVEGFDFKDNPIRSGHATFLANAVQMLVAAGRIEQADKYYRFLKEDYGKSGRHYDKESAEEFVLARLSDPYEERHFVSSVAISQMTIALQRAFIRLAQADTDGYRRSLAYARRIHKIYQDKIVERLVLPPFEQFAAPVLASLLAEPRTAGYNLSLLTRARMYSATGVVWARLQVLVYDAIQRPLRARCRDQGLDFEKAFPAPAGLEQYRRQMMRRLPVDDE